MSLPRRILLLLAALALLYTGWNFLSPSRRLLSAQRSFLTAVSGKDEARCLALVAEDYADQWSFTKREWPGVLKDLRALAPVLEITAENPIADTGAGTVKARLIAKALGGPAAQELESMVARSKEPATFTWRRESWLPWSWRLTAIAYPDLEIPSGYRPGSFSESSPF